MPENNPTPNPPPTIPNFNDIDIPQQIYQLLIGPYFCNICHEQIETLNYKCFRTEYGQEEIESGDAETEDTEDAINWTYYCPSCQHETDRNIVKIYTLEKIYETNPHPILTTLTMLQQPHYTTDQLPLISYSFPKKHKTQTMPERIIETEINLKPPAISNDSISPPQYFKCTNPKCHHLILTNQHVKETATDEKITFHLESPIICPNCFKTYKRQVTINKLCTHYSFV